MEERYRERNSSLGIAGGSFVQRRLTTPPTVQISSLGSTQYLNFVEKMWDLVDPDYFEKKKAGSLLPINPMSHEGKTLIAGSQSGIVVTPGTWVHRYDYPSKGKAYMDQTFSDLTPFWNAGGVRVPMTAGIPGSSGTIPPVPSLAYMLQEARAKCHSEGSGVDLGTLLAELDKSADLLKEVHTRALKRARRVIDAAVAIRKGDLNRSYRLLTRASKVADLLSIASQLWLEYRFGWRLLVQDLEALQEIYARQDSFGRSLSRGTYQFTTESSPIVVTSDTYKSTIALNAFSSTAWGRYVYGADKLVRRTIRVGVMEQFDNANPFFGDPFVTLWELVPLSWVADMFANVGHAIMAWSPFVSGRPVHQWVSDEVTHINRRRMVPDLSYTKVVGGTDYYYMLSGEPLVAEYGTRYYSRVATALQMPTIGLKADISATKIRKWMDVGAVAAQFGNKVVQMAVSSIKAGL